MTMRNIADLVAIYNAAVRADATAIADDAPTLPAYSAMLSARDALRDALAQRYVDAGAAWPDARRRAVCDVPTGKMLVAEDKSW